MGKRQENNHNIRRTIGVILLAFAVAVTSLPFYVFAEGDIPGKDEVTDKDLQDICDIVTDEDVNEGSSDDDTAYPDDLSEEDICDLEAVNPDPGIADQDTLLEMYIENEAGLMTAAPETAVTEESVPEPSTPMLKSAARRKRLTTEEKKMYDGIKKGVFRIAAGSTRYAKITVPMTYSEFAACDFDLVIRALLTDYPYEMYWYDKTSGVLRGYNTVNSYAVLYFSVSEDYRSSEEPAKIPYGDGYFKLYNLNSSKTKAASDAVSNARKVVDYFADYSDLEKLYIYKEVIGELTDYNTEVTLKSPYGDPWQLIYVFDGYDDTKVVCEGYSKAFQLLCDMTGFDNIESRIVTGSFYSASHPSGENHMWNVIRMDDGKNYLADITNSDNDMAGYPDLLFLRGYNSGSMSSGYTFVTPAGNVRYEYDGATAFGFYDSNGNYHSPAYGTAELQLSGADYSSDNVKTVHHKRVAPTCTRSGRTEYWTLPTSNGTEYYLDGNCSMKTTSGGIVLKALGHSWKTTSDLLDVRYQKCTRCGKTRKVSKVTVDLPKVKIRKPVRAKKGFTVRWKKVSAKNRRKIKGIEIQYSINKNFKSPYKVKKASRKAVDKKIKKLKKRKYYYVRIRAYKVINRRKHVSKWSKVKRVRTK